MSDRRGYPTAYRRSALPQHVRQRGFQPLPMLPVSPRTPLRVGKYARWAGRLARLHPAVRTISTIVDLAEMFPQQPTVNDDWDFEQKPGVTLLGKCTNTYPVVGPPGWASHSSASSPGCANWSNTLCSVYSSFHGVGSWPPPPSAGRRVLKYVVPYSLSPLRGRSMMEFCVEAGVEAPQVYAPGEKAVPGRIVLPDAPSYRPPQWQPERWPIGVPAGVPVPVPYPEIPGRLPDPNRSPTEQTEFGNEPPNPQPVPAVPTPGVIVLPTPGNPSPEPSPSPQPDTPFPGPPATSRTRERKVILAVAGVPARIISAATETKDVIDAFWSAMPEKFQRAHKFRYGRLTRPHEKALLIWENLDQLDIGAAITNLAWEQLEDMAYGRLGKLQARAARKRRAMHGFTLGPAL